MRLGVVLVVCFVCGRSLILNSDTTGIDLEKMQRGLQEVGEHLQMAEEDLQAEKSHQKYLFLASRGCTGRRPYFGREACCNGQPADEHRQAGTPRVISYNNAYKLALR